MVCIRSLHYSLMVRNSRSNGSIYIVFASLDLFQIYPYGCVCSSLNFFVRQQSSSIVCDSIERSWMNLWIVIVNLILKSEVSITKVVFLFSCRISTRSSYEMKRSWNFFDKWSKFFRSFRRKIETRKIFEWRENMYFLYLFVFV